MAVRAGAFGEREADQARNNEQVNGKEFQERGKDAAAAVEISNIASFEMIPCAIAHSFCQHGVEHQAARGG